MLERIVPWGPAFFGVLIFAPVVAAVLDANSLGPVGGIPNLYFTALLGLTWGIVAKLRGRWL